MLSYANAHLSQVETQDKPKHGDIFRPNYTFVRTSSPEQAVLVKWGADSAHSGKHNSCKAEGKSIGVLCVPSRSVMSDSLQPGRL